MKRMNYDLNEKFTRQIERRKRKRKSIDQYVFSHDSIQSRQTMICEKMFNARFEH